MYLAYNLKNEKMGNLLHTHFFVPHFRLFILQSMDTGNYACNFRKSDHSRETNKSVVKICYLYYLK